MAERPKDLPPTSPLQGLLDAPILSEQAVSAIDAVAIVNAINRLRGNEGASVTIPCDNPDGTGPDNILVEVADDWTNWQPLHFYGRTLRLALENAEHERRLNPAR